MTGAGPGIDVVFFDGDCGLCNRFVASAARRDVNGEHFRFAPIGGTTFTETFGAETPDRNTVLVLTSSGRRLVRSDAVLYVLRRQGGGRRALAAILGVIPCPLRDLGYRLVARFRRRVFGGVTRCPVPPAEWRTRLLP